MRRFLFWTHLSIGLTAGLFILRTQSVFRRGLPSAQARRFLRFVRTGEVFGLIGQTIAALASLGAVVLTYTGLSLGLRRLIRLSRRPRRTAGSSDPDRTT